MVLGDKAYSWATKHEELPEKGKPLILFEQPVHTREYALSEKVIIPKGEYGAGVTTLDFARKGFVDRNRDGDHWVVHAGRDHFLLKPLPEKYGEKAWLFARVGAHTKKKKILKEDLVKKAAEFYSLFQRADNISSDPVFHNGTPIPGTKLHFTKDPRSRARHMMNMVNLKKGNLHRLLKGDYTYGHIQEEGAGFDHVNRYAGSFTTYHFRKDDFKKGGKELALSKFKNHLNAFANELGRDRLRTGFDHKIYTNQALRNFELNYQKAKLAHNIRQGLKGSLILGTIMAGLYGAKKVFGKNKGN
jgi:hypothetical protein